MNLRFAFRALAAAGISLLCAVEARSQQNAARHRTAAETMPLVEGYCGGCHYPPPPDVLPKRTWPVVIEAMAQIAQKRTGRVGLSRQQLDDIMAFYYTFAPEELPRLPPIPDAPSARLFIAQDLGASSPLPFVTNVNTSHLVATHGAQLIACDGAAKRVILMEQRRGKWRETPVADVEIPVHTQVVDIDGDGDLDVLTADLGEFPAIESHAGKVLLLRQVAPGRFVRESLQEGLGRVSDARAADIDGDGDMDVVVAEFGGGDVGEVFWLENTDGGAAPKYRKRILFGRSGAITVLPADLNEDGRMDLVALIAQEHEAVIAFIATGSGEFKQRVIWRASHPMYGSTGLSLVDLDRDGDLDVVLTNGDAFDVQTDPKPYHGVQWLENTGALRFVFHDIGRFYGAAVAAAGDLDGDGDLDVVAASWVNYWMEPGGYSLVWYENDGGQNFTPHGIAARPTGIVSLQLSDVDGDGSLDIVAGSLRMDLLIAKSGASYRAARLFPAAPESGLLPRIVLFKNLSR